MVEESRQRVGTAQSTGMVKWGVATLETQHFGIHITYIPVLCNTTLLSYNCQITFNGCHQYFEVYGTYWPLGNIQVHTLAFGENLYCCTAGLHTYRL